ncbi:unnamed protein product [Didymodactylos carnosus]|uniref:RING-type domain-containing protein n=1 Tax=Didymodactylos carnosus TaxID=1234261 RepID=A0A8S2NP30_9BILA|nr:unnamed protein product [Didymodactylos carnosus]CAF4012063.1 unnamed protein product [Didymodactylos carnosus]
METPPIIETQCNLRKEIHPENFGSSITDLNQASNAMESHSEAVIKAQKLQTEASAHADQATRLMQQHSEPDSTPSSTTVRDFTELDTIRAIRERTFSHWPHKVPSKKQIIEAGFFGCNVGDRVICIYCNIICQQWMAHSDDPAEIHKTLSPNCSYVKSVLGKNILSNNIRIVNEIIDPSSQMTSMNDNISPASTSYPLHCDEIVLTAACNVSYIEIPKRQASFATWSNELLPSVDDLVKSGFYYTGVKTIVTCFYCNGSLQNWGQTDNPMVEHARWFPHCAYARQLCGDYLYQKIQDAKLATQEFSREKEQELKGFSISNINGNSKSNNSVNGSTMNRTVSKILDEATLSKLVAARLDLPISQSLLSKKFKLSIIKRCYEDQLRLKHDDFVSDSDLLLACVILQKQIDYIDGKTENIIIPSIYMKKVREHATKKAMETENNESQNGQLSALSSSARDANVIALTNESCTSTSTASSMDLSSVAKPTTKPQGKIKQQDQANGVSNLCVICFADEKRLACIPCGHLATCVPCGHSLRTCPICRRDIDAFVRVYI